MGIFESTLFEKLRKSTGNVTTYVSGGQQIVRAKSSFRKDRKSKAQLRQRNRMQTLKDIWGDFRALTPEGFCTTSLKTAWNRFVQANLMREGMERGLSETADWLNVSIAQGPLLPPLLTAKIDGETKTITFRWQRQPDRPNCIGTDHLFGAVIDIGETDCMYWELGTRENDGEMTVPLPKDFKRKRMAVYGYAKNAAGTRTSNSLGLAIWEKNSKKKQRSKAKSD